MIAGCLGPLGNDTVSTDRTLNEGISCCSFVGRYQESGAFLLVGPSQFEIEVASWPA